MSHSDLYKHLKYAVLESYAAMLNLGQVHSIYIVPTHSAVFVNGDLAIDGGGYQCCLISLHGYYKTRPGI